LDISLGSASTLYEYESVMPRIIAFQSTTERHWQVVVEPGASDALVQTTGGEKT
jgi:hypothetical protein